MTFLERLKGAAIGLVVVIVCAPIAVVTTLLTMPFWTWVEGTFSIEAVGHSGPAEWCYLATYLVLVVISGLVVYRSW